MKIEVGKDYRTRGGDKIHITTDIHSLPTYKYYGVIKTGCFRDHGQHYDGRGRVYQFRESRLDIIAPWEEEMKIEIGSEWVSSIGERFTVLAIDENRLFVKYYDGEHRIISEHGLRLFCKPAPKRRFVYFNVYEHKVGLPYNSEEECRERAGEGLLWTQKVELIDPRGGDNE